MKTLHTLRGLLLSAAALATMFLPGCAPYYPGGYYGAGARTASHGSDGKDVQSADDYSPPPASDAPARTVYVPRYYPAYYRPYPLYYPAYYAGWYGYGYWPRYYGGYYGHYHGHYGHGHSHGHHH
jgi:hypothetical protein